MRKLFCKLGMALLLTVLFAGCGSNSRGAVAGTWYGDNADMLELKADGSYASTWLGEGKFRVEGDTVLLTGTGMAEGSARELRIANTEGKKVLREEPLALTYYSVSSDATAAMEKREEALRVEEEQQAAKELELLKEALIGTWEWAGYAGEVTFGEDGTMSGTVSGMKPGKYEVVDLNNLKIENEEQVYTKRIQYTKEGSVQKLIFGTLNLVKK